LKQEDLGVGWMIILTLILKKYYVRVWIGFTWLKIGFRDRLF
jgi:hypothetical protein